MAESTVVTRSGAVSPQLPAISQPIPGTPRTSNARNPLDDAHQLPQVQGKRTFVSPFLGYRLTLVSREGGAVIQNGEVIKIPGKDLTALFNHGLLMVDLETREGRELDCLLMSHPLRGRTFHAQEDLIRDARNRQLANLKDTLKAHPDLIQELKGSLNAEDFQIIRLLVEKERMAEEGESSEPEKPTKPAPAKKL